jgi:hypothetical protein
MPERKLDARPQTVGSRRWRCSRGTVCALFAFYQRFSLAVQQFSSWPVSWNPAILLMIFTSDNVVK